MSILPTQLLKHACKLYLDCAYPDGPETIPDFAREFSCIPDDMNVSEYLPCLPRAQGHVRQLEGAHPGYSVRLGCSVFPYLRLTFQQIECEGVANWLCAVDTHDSWHHPEHADAAGWLAVQSANRALKERIETAWDEAGILTHNRLLRRELPSATR